MGVAVTSAVSVIGALLVLRRQKVGRDQRACFDRLDQAGFQRYDKERRRYCKVEGGLECTTQRRRRLRSS